MEKMRWTDHVRNEEILYRVKEDRNIIHTIKRSKGNWFGHILCRNCLLQHLKDGMIQGREKLQEDKEDVSSCWKTLRK
jgi:hypothetical protein